MMFRRMAKVCWSRRMRATAMTTSACSILPQKRSTGSRLLYYHNGPNSPKDAWVYSIADGNSRRVTYSLMAGVPASHMVEPQLVHYPSRDGKWTISALLYVPHNMRRDGQNAAIVYVH